MSTAVSKISLSFPKKRGEEYLIFSLPQTNNYQEIIDLTTIPFETQNLSENKVAIFYLNDVGKEIKINLQIKLKSYSMSIDKNYKISDYSRNVFNPNRFIDGQDSEIIKMANQVVGKEKNLKIIVKNLYLFTREYLTYGKPIEGLYTYKQAMEERTTDCGGFSTFLSSLLQSQNIPTRLVIGYIVKQNLLDRFFPTFHFSLFTFNSLSMHAWLEVMLPNKSWFPIDPSTGKFGSIPANRLVTSFSCDFNLKINNKNYQIDLFQNPIYL